MRLLIIIINHYFDKKWCDNIKCLNDFMMMNNMEIDYCGISNSNEFHVFENIIQFKYKIINTKMQLSKICDFITDYKSWLDYDWFMKFRPGITLLENINFNILSEHAINARARVYHGPRKIKYGMNVKDTDCYYDTIEHDIIMDDMLYIFHKNVVQKNAFDKIIVPNHIEYEWAHTSLFNERKIQHNIIGINLVLTEHGTFSGDINMDTPFNCDYQVEKQILHLINKFDIKCCIETGTYMGESTIWFSKHVNEVYSVEINDKYYNISLDKFTKNNITNINVFKDDSVNFLQNNIKNIKSKYDKILCYLDAHWEEVFPLCNEILEIAKVYRDNLIIIIDDIKVPNKNFQFDTYNGKEIGLPLVHEALNEVGEYLYYYSNTSESYHQNLRPNCCGVGKLYIISSKLLKDNNLNQNQFCVTENYINYANVI